MRKGSAREGAMYPLMLAFGSFLAVGATGGSNSHVGILVAVVAAAFLVAVNACVRRIEDDKFKDGIMVTSTLNFVAQIFGAAVTVSHNAPRARAMFAVVYVLFFLAAVVSAIVMPLEDRESE